MTTALKADKAREILSLHLARLRQKFIVRLADEHQLLACARATGDTETMRRVAHGLAGVAATFGYAEIGEAAVALQSAIDGETSSMELQRVLGHLIDLIGNTGSAGDND